MFFGSCVPYPNALYSSRHTREQLCYDIRMRIIVALVFASLSFAQRLEFEVASVKPNTSSELGSNFNRMPGGGLHAINVTLRELIRFAYDIGDHQLIGVSGWMGSDRYDI